MAAPWSATINLRMAMGADTRIEGCSSIASALRRYSIGLVLIALAQLLFVGPSGAIQGGAVTAAEAALLPEYCPHTIMFGAKYGGTKEGLTHWTARLGKHFNSMHHYCWALVAQQRAMRPGVPANDRIFNNQRAIAEIDYVLNLVDESFPLLPEMYTRRGESLSRLKQYADAERSFRRALDLKRDYWPAYRSLAQSHLDQGRKADALKLLEESVGQVSDARVLERMLNDIRREVK